MPVLTENTGTNTRAALLYVLISNALQGYGILYLEWHFFPILYMWWWEAFLLALFGWLLLRKQRPHLLKLEDESTVMEGERSARLRFFPIFIYFVFVIVLAGFMFAPRDSWVANMITLVFGNKVFNINLLLFFCLQLLQYLQSAGSETPLAPAHVQALRSTMDTRNMVLHVGLLIGALMSYLLPKFMPHAEHAFMFGFMAIKLGGDIYTVLKRTN